MPSEDVTEYKAGDVVRLLSGGPWMTVEGVGEVNAVCVWFAGNPEGSGEWTGPHREAFPVALLQQHRVEPHAIVYGSGFTDESSRQRARLAKAMSDGLADEPAKAKP